eukprot:scaffold189697_cov12-Prasinocladus_malaysianus.AAC.2
MASLFDNDERADRTTEIAKAFMKKKITDTVEIAMKWFKCAEKQDLKTGPTHLGARNAAANAIT